MFTLTAKRPLGLLFIAVTASATQAEVRPSNSDSADILARSSQWMDAMDRQDRGTLERVIGDSFQLHLLYGNDSDVTPRLKWIDNAVERRWRHNGYDNVNIVTRGDHAVMSSTQNFAPPAGGLLKPAVNTSGAVVDIWERQDGEWKVVGGTLVDGPSLSGLTGSWGLSRVRSYLVL